MTILGYVLIVIGVSIICILTSGSLKSLLAILILIVGIGFVVANEMEETPKAIEVYQGKTTLEITYRDSIPVDSVVVYKK